MICWGSFWLGVGATFGASAMMTALWIAADIKFRVRR